MRSKIIAISICLGLTAPMVASIALAQPAAEVMDAGQVGSAAEPPSAPTPAEVDVANPPDPIAAPSSAWDAVVTWFKRSRWMGIAIALLILATAYRKRMQPSGDEPAAIGWRAMSIAIASAIVAVAGPLVEFGMGTGGWTAVMMGIGLAVGLVVDRKNPPKGAPTKV